MHGVSMCFLLRTMYFHRVHRGWFSITRLVPNTIRITYWRTYLHTRRHSGYVSIETVSIKTALLLKCSQLELFTIRTTYCIHDGRVVSMLRGFQRTMVCRSPGTLMKTKPLSFWHYIQYNNTITFYNFKLKQCCLWGHILRHYRKYDKLLFTIIWNCALFLHSIWRSRRSSN